MPVIVLFVSAIVFVPMLFEASRAARNERAQLARGGIEPPGDVYAVMRAAYPGAFLAMAIEGAIGDGPPVRLLRAGVVLFVLAKGLKWWAVRSLGPSWTFRVIVVPGMPIVTAGPYRYLRHPNYVAVMAELVSVAMMTGARVVGPIAVAGFCVLIARRIAIERRALDRLAAASDGRGAILRRE